MSEGLLSEPALSRKAQARVLLPFALVTLIWGSTWLVIRDQLGTVPASWSVSYRFAIASAAMFVFARATRSCLRLGARDQFFALLIGFTQFFLNFNFVYPAEEHITSGLVALLFALLVVPNALLGWIFLRQGVSRPFLAGAAVALAGLALLFTHEIETAPTGGKTALGILLTLAAVLSASTANVMQATRRAQSLPMPSLLAWAMLWGALIDAAWAWITTGPPIFDPRPSYVAGLLYLGLIASALAFSLYFGIIRAIGPGRAAYSSVLVPLIAMALSTIFEGYRWSWEAAAGGGLALVGLLISLSARRPAR
jgi:drug/metabolite transporter (DMT)-like permease